MIMNEPNLWIDKWHQPGPDDHKYSRGHAVILGARELTGATRLASEACSYLGAGLVSVAAPEKGDIYRATLPADIMVSEDCESLASKASVILAGPGGAPFQGEALLELLGKAQHAVLDADAVAAKESHLGETQCMLTPHEGEFRRYFPDLTGTRAEQARAAAAQTNAIVVLKGYSTVIAAPDGQIVTNNHASPYLAKAGTGDVLAGMITSLVAQKMEPFDAACAAVWIHGEAGRLLGPGLIASDIPSVLPKIMRVLIHQGG